MGLQCNAIWRINFRAKRTDTDLQGGKLFFFREDIDDVETEISKEEAPGRNPISKLGKSKSEEVDTHTDRSSSGPTGKNYLNICSKESPSSISL